MVTLPCRFKKAALIVTGHDSLCPAFFILWFSEEPVKLFHTIDPSGGKANLGRGAAPPAGRKKRSRPERRIIRHKKICPVGSLK